MSSILSYDLNSWLPLMPWGTGQHAPGGNAGLRSAGKNPANLASTTPGAGFINNVELMYSYGRQYSHRETNRQIYAGGLGGSYASGVNYYLSALYAEQSWRGTLDTTNGSQNYNNLEQRMSLAYGQSLPWSFLNTRFFIGGALNANSMTIGPKQNIYSRLSADLGASALWLNKNPGLLGGIGLGFGLRNMSYPVNIGEVTYMPDSEWGTGLSILGNISRQQRLLFNLDYNSEIYSSSWNTMFSTKYSYDLYRYLSISPQLGYGYINKFDYSSSQLYRAGLSIQSDITLINAREKIIEKYAEGYIEAQVETSGSVRLKFKANPYSHRETLCQMKNITEISRIVNSLKYKIALTSRSFVQGDGLDKTEIIITDDRGNEKFRQAFRTTYLSSGQLLSELPSQIDFSVPIQEGGRSYNTTYNYFAFDGKLLSAETKKSRVLGIEDDNVLYAIKNFSINKQLIVDDRRLERWNYQEWKKLVDKAGIPEERTLSINELTETMLNISMYYHGLLMLSDTRAAKLNRELNLKTYRADQVYEGCTDSEEFIDSMDCMRRYAKNYFQEILKKYKQVRYISFAKIETNRENWQRIYDSKRVSTEELAIPYDRAYEIRYGKNGLPRPIREQINLLTSNKLVDPDKLRVLADSLNWQEKDFVASRTIASTKRIAINYKDMRKISEIPSGEQRNRYIIENYLQPVLNRSNGLISRVLDVRTSDLSAGRKKQLVKVSEYHPVKVNLDAGVNMDLQVTPNREYINNLLFYLQAGIKF